MLLLCFLCFAARTDDKPVRALVFAGFRALGALAPRRHRMAAARGAAFAAAVRMIHRVHRHAAYAGTDAFPARAAGFADHFVLVVGIGYSTDGRHAFAANDTHFGGAHFHLHIPRILADDLGISAGRPGDLAAFADFHFDVVHDGADGNVAQLHGKARLHVGLFAGADHVAHRKALR